MKMRAQDGHLFAEVTLRDVLERTDVSDMPMLSEIKRLYDENAKLRELARDFMAFFEDDDACSHCGHDRECSEQGLVLAYEDDCLMRGVFRDRMREMGVE